MSLLVCCLSVQLYVLMDYCRHGCLRDYLVSHRQNFHDTMDAIEKPIVWFREPKHVSLQLKTADAESDVDEDSDDDHVALTTRHLVSYALQIASGMEFLASQKVLTTAPLICFHGCFLLILSCLALSLVAVRGFDCVCYTAHTSRPGCT